MRARATAAPEAELFVPTCAIQTAVEGNELCGWLEDKFSSATNTLVAANIKEKLKELGC